MNPTIAVALITGCITALGWVVTNYLAQRALAQRIRTEASLRFVERQLEELYGPLVAQLYEGRQAFQDLLASLGRTSVFRGYSELPPDELRTWLYWAESVFLPRNRLIRDLLTTKAHLVVGNDLPQSHIAFFEHESSWRVHHERWQKEQVEYSWHSNVNWPVEFERDVIATFSALKARHSELLGSLNAN